MKTKHSAFKIAFLGLFLATLTCVMAFQDSTIVRSQLTKIDTLPNNPDIHIDIDMKDLDKAMREIDLQLEKAGKQLKDVDWDKISKQISESMKNIDLAKIELDIKNSMKDINFDKIKLEIENSLKGVNLDKIKLDIKKSMKDVDWDKIKAEVKHEMEKARVEIDFNKDDIKKEMEHAKEEMNRAKEEMKKAKVEMNVAKEEMKDIKEMVSELEKDGLIDTKKSYSIEYRDKELYINGKKQPNEVKEKYLKYIKGEKFKLSKSADGALALPPGCGLWISAYI